MKLWANLRGAFDGWVLLLRGDPAWQQRFSLTAPGLVTAIAVFYIFAFLAIVLASLDVGVPTLDGVINVMVVQSLWLVALWLGIVLAGYAVAPNCSKRTLLVPGIYALIFYLVVGALLALTLGFLLPLLWLGLVYLLYRLGRAAAGWSMGVAAAFAVLTVVLLVGMPMALYMLATTFLPNAA